MKYFYQGIEYNVMELSKLLCEQFNCHPDTIRKRIKKHGVDGAIKVSLSYKNNHTHVTPLPEVDKDLELKRRIANWVKLYGVKSTIEKIRLEKTAT